MKNIPWINSARGFAILLVVLFHSTQWAGSAGYQSPAWREVNEALASIRLPLFFALSGMLAVGWMTRSWRDLLRIKIATLVWLYVVWQTVTTLVYMVVPNVATPGKGNVRELATAVLTPVLPQGALWFIWALGVFFIAAKVLVRVNQYLVIGLAAAASTVVTSGVVELGNVGWDGAVSNFVFFFAGTAFATPLKGLGAKISPAIAVLTVAAWVAVIVVVPWQDAIGVNLAIRALGIGAGIAVGSLLATVRPLEWTGRHTLYLYLPHYPILMVLAYATSRLNLPSTAGAWLSPVFFAIAVLLCLGLYGLARRSVFIHSAFDLPPIAAKALR